VRTAVDLVEAETGAQIWSERFEGTLDDVFALQDEVANAVAARIEPTIQAADLRRGAARPTDDLGAYDLLLRGQQRLREYDQAGVQGAIDLFEEAVARDATFVAAWGYLAWLRVFNGRMGWSADREETQRTAQEAIRHVLLANDADADTMVRVAWASAALGGDRHAATAMADRALALNPGSFGCWMWGGWVSSTCQQYEPALERFHYALRLNPRAPDRHAALMGIAVALLSLARFEEALPWLNEAVTLRPSWPPGLFYLTISLSHLNRIDEARSALARFEAVSSLKAWLVAGSASTETARSALRRLGVDV
jgi:tetratricopeptide (TPR) repeat protein